MFDKIAFNITFIYIVFGSLWILFSDQFVAKLTQDPYLMTILAMIKGWLFIFVTGGLLYGLISRANADLRVTEQDLRAANARYESVLQAANTYSIIATDETGLIKIFNEGAERLLGYSAFELVDKETVALLHDQEEIELRAKELGLAPDFGIFIAAARQNKTEKREWTYLAKDGRRIPVELSVSAQHDASGKINGFLGIANDITTRQQAENDLLAANSELERRVLERTQELLKANHELLNANTEQSLLNERLRNAQKELVRSEKMASLARLVAGIAHEINTPVGLCVTLASHLNQFNDAFASLYASGEMKRSDLEGYLFETQEACRMLQLNSERAAKLVNNFKQVSADQASEARRIFEVRSYLDEILLSLSARLKNSGHLISVSGSDKILMDGYPGAFAQIITNLLLNSLIHAYDPDCIGKIELKLIQNEAELLLFYSDDGKGMNPEVLAKIYEPFFTTRRNQGGTGLGMSIVYNLVTQLYGGTIQCESTPQEGTLFTIKLPLVANETE